MLFSYYFSEAPAIVPKDVQVSQSSSASQVHTSQDSKVVSQVKGQGQQEEITQNSIIGAGEEDEEEELVQARVNLSDWDPVSIDRGSYMSAHGTMPLPDLNWAEEFQMTKSN